MCILNKYLQISYKLYTLLDKTLIYTLVKVKDIKNALISSITSTFHLCSSLYVFVLKFMFFLVLFMDYFFTYLLTYLSTRTRIRFESLLTWALNFDNQTFSF